MEIAGKSSSEGLRTSVRDGVSVLVLEADQDRESEEAIFVDKGKGLFVPGHVTQEVKKFDNPVFTNHSYAVVCSIKGYGL